MIELARAGAPFGYLFFGREELPAGESSLPTLLRAPRPRRRPRRDARADRQHDPGRLPREPQRAARLPRHELALGAAVARRQRDHARRRRTRAARVARAARRRDRRARVPRGAQRDADRGRHRDERHPGARRGDPQLPLRAGPHAGGRGGASARARGRRRRARAARKLAAGARRRRVAARAGAPRRPATSRSSRSRRGRRSRSSPRRGSTP